MVKMKVKKNKKKQDVLGEMVVRFLQMYSLENRIASSFHDHFSHDISVKKNMSRRRIWINQNITWIFFLRRSKRGPRQEKLNKAHGIEDIPNQELKSPNLLVVLTHFVKDQIPSVCWTSRTEPIPQSHDPGRAQRYRGISSFSSVYGFLYIIEYIRLAQYLERGHCVVAEQNGFRKNRACAENIHSVASVIGPRLTEAEAETMLSFKLHTIG